MNEFTKTKIHFTLALLAALFALHPFLDKLEDVKFDYLGYPLKFSYAYVVFAGLLALCVYLFALTMVSERPHSWLERLGNYCYGLAIMSLPFYGGLYLASLLAEQLGESRHLAYAAPGVALGLGIGWGRAHLGDAAGFGSRYVTLAAPLLCCAYFAWVLYSGRLVPRLLLLTFAVFAAVDTVQGLQRGARRAEATAAIHADIRRGLSPKQLGDKYASAIGLPGGEDIFAGRLEMMRQARQGPYRHQPEE